MTQAPLEHTIYDFWHMVHQYKIGSVVMLNLLQEGEEVRLMQLHMRASFGKEECRI